jgi:hypothetical protein
VKVIIGVDPHKSVNAVAAFVVWQGYGSAGPSALGWVGFLSAPQLMALVLVLVALALLAGLWWFFLHLLRQYGRLLVRVEALEARLGVGGAMPPSGNGAQQHTAGLPVGSEAPAFNLSGLHGEMLTLESSRSSGKPSIRARFLSRRAGEVPRRELPG